MPRAPLLSLAWKESRTARRRLLVYMSAISLGVAALVAIDSFASNTQRSVREQARALLGGDISITSRQPFTPRVAAALDSMRARGVAFADITTFASMALVDRTGRTRLAQVRAVTPGYPFYGSILTAPAGAWSRLQSGRVALVDPSLLVSLNARVGDTLSLGKSRFAIIGTLVSVPGDVSVASAIGPRIYIPDRFVSETGLLQFGSRSDRETLVKLPATLSAGQFTGRLRPALDSAGVRMRTPAESSTGRSRPVNCPALSVGGSLTSVSRSERLPNCSSPVSATN